MSSAYGLFHVFNELLDEKANKNTTARGKTMGAKSEIYQGAWSALNAWIETKLAKQKVRPIISLYSVNLSLLVFTVVIVDSNKNCQLLSLSGSWYFRLWLLLLGAETKRRHHPVSTNIYTI